MLHRFARALLLASVLTALTAGAALGHECYVVNRSEQGNQGAANAPVWDTLTLANLFATAHEFFGGDPLTPDQVAWAVAAAEGEGIPSSVTIFVGNRTIGQNGRAFTEMGKATDGQGIDWFFTAHGDALAGIFFAAREH